MSRIDVVYAASLKPGDLYAGNVQPDAPTRPVQEFAAAWKLASVERFKVDGRTWIRPASASFELTPVPAVTQCLVIRP